MFQNVLLTTITPVCDKNENQNWENRPFINKWPETKHKKDSSIKKTIRKKNKRNRTAYTTEQLRVLEKTYVHTKYINAERRKQLADSLAIGEKCIKVWFQNRRMKEKRESSESSCDTSSEGFIAEPITPPPQNIPDNSNKQYIDSNYNYGIIQHNQNERNPYCTFDENVTPESLHMAYYQNYEQMSYQNYNYNPHSHLNDYFRNDTNIYPTQYFPSNHDSTNCNVNQNGQRNDLYNWSAIDLNYF